MSGLISSLLANAKTLSAQTQQISTTGKNLQHVGDESYAKQTANVADSGTVETAYGLQSMGLTVSSITSSRNAIIDNQILRETWNNSSLEAKYQMSALIESAFGESIDTTSTTGSKSGIYAALDDFFNKASAAAASPGEAATQQSFLEAAQTLCDLVNGLNTSLEQIDSDIVSNIDAKTSDANTILSEIATLNKEIARLELTSGQQALDLRDARQAKLEKLAEIMNFTTSTSASGSLAISVLSEAGSPVTLVDGVNVQGTLSYTGTNYVVTSGSTTTNVSVTGGSLHGLHAIRASTTDLSLATLSDDLDALKNQLVDSVNGVYSQGVVGTPNTFFELNAAGDLKIVDGIDASTLKTATDGESGNTDILQQIADLASASFDGTTDYISGSFSDYYNSMVTSVGQEMSSTETLKETSDLVLNTLKTQRDSESGVDTNEEMTHLLLFERAFQGTSRVISMLDDMLSIIVNDLGRF